MCLCVGWWDFICGSSDRATKCLKILMFVTRNDTDNAHCSGNQPCKSHEILMFVCLQKDAKQCCEVTKLDCTHCAGDLKNQPDLNH